MNKIDCEIQDQDDKILLGTFDGLWQFDTHYRVYKRLVGKANDIEYERLITTVFKDSQKQIWFGNWSKGLKRFEINEQ